MPQGRCNAHLPGNPHESLSVAPSPGDSQDAVRKKRIVDQHLKQIIHMIDRGASKIPLQNLSKREFAKLISDLGWERLFLAAIRTNPSQAEIAAELGRQSTHFPDSLTEVMQRWMLENREHPFTTASKFSADLDTLKLPPRRTYKKRGAKQPEQALDPKAELSKHAKTRIRNAQEAKEASLFFQRHSGDPAALAELYILDKREQIALVLHACMRCNVDDTFNASVQNLAANPQIRFMPGPLLEKLTRFALKNPLHPISKGLAENIRFLTHCAQYGYIDKFKRDLPEEATPETAPFAYRLIT